MAAAERMWRGRREDVGEDEALSLQGMVGGWRESAAFDVEDAVSDLVWNL